MSADLLIKPVGTLSSTIVSFAELQKKWKCDKRYPESAIQRFIKLNTKAFEFLGLKAEGIFHNGKYALMLTSSNYVGCIPTLSPSTGKPCGDIMVTGRFNEDILELLSVTGDSILPDFNDELMLSSGETTRPPLYFECANYIDLYIEAQKGKWKKFTNELRHKPTPDSSTQWEKYAIYSTDPLKTFIYPNKSNLLINNHNEWKELTHVLQLAISEIESPRTPLRSKTSYADKITKLKSTVRFEQITQIPRINIRMSDPVTIKALKQVANIILGDVSNKKLAWRLDFSVFFERYIQHLLLNIARQKGAKEHCNPRYGITASNKPNWCLHYLEPDIVLQRGEKQYVIDAKYKSHIYNIRSNTEELRDTFRHDLHQILAYTSLNNMPNKKAILIYPASELSVSSIVIRSQLSDVKSKVQMIGIPLRKSEVSNIQKELQQIIQFE